MDGEDRFTGYSVPSAAAPFDLPLGLDGCFTAEYYRELQDAADRRARVADVVASALSPRLVALHAAVLPAGHPTVANVTELARLVLSPDEREAAAYVASLRESGICVELLFSELLEPAARLLGECWERDELDFIDVTLGVARLQALLSVFNSTHAVVAMGDCRSVLMMTVPGEQHSFGVAMVEQSLEAGGWHVTSEREVTLENLARLVSREWFAVAGIALSNERNLDKVGAAIAAIRKHSCNRAIGIMVGGSMFGADAGLAGELGADGTAASGPTAVVLAQKLLDRALAADRSRRGHDLLEGNLEPLRTQSVRRL